MIAVAITLDPLRYTGHLEPMVPCTLALITDYERTAEELLLFVPLNR